MRTGSRIAKQGSGSVRAIMQGLTDAEFEQYYGTEEMCLAALVTARQAVGMHCPQCGNRKTYVYGRHCHVNFQRAP